jgi:hypothetical protein
MVAGSGGVLLLALVASIRVGGKRVTLFIHLARTDGLDTTLGFGLLLVVRIVDLVVSDLFVPHVACVTALHGAQELGEDISALPGKVEDRASSLNGIAVDRGGRGEANRIHGIVDRAERFKDEAEHLAVVEAEQTACVEDAVFALALTLSTGAVHRSGMAVRWVRLRILLHILLDYDDAVDDGMHFAELSQGRFVRARQHSNSRLLDLWGQDLVLSRWRRASARASTFFVIVIGRQGLASIASVVLCILVFVLG